MDSIFTALMSPVKVVTSFFSPTASKEKNPLATPPSGYGHTEATGTPSHGGLTPTAKAKRGTKGNISFNKNMTVEGTTGFERVVLPGEQRKKKKAMKSPPRSPLRSPPKLKSPPKKKETKKETKKKETKKETKKKETKKKETKKEMKKKATPKNTKKTVAKKTTTPKKSASKTTPMILAKVKTEATRSSRRSSTYKKGMYSQKRLENIAWQGGGSVSDPIVFM